MPNKTTDKTANKPYRVEPMISAKSIAARVEELASDITTHFSGTDKLIVIGLLRGSFMFIADLVRELDLPVEIDFVETSSYGNAMESSGEVRILKDLRGLIEGRDVLVVEDIVDTGAHFESRFEPAEIARPCAVRGLRSAGQTRKARD